MRVFFRSEWGSCERHFAEAPEMNPELEYMLLGIILIALILGVLVA